MAGGKASRSKLKLAQRRARATELRKAGHTYQQIADTIAAELGSTYTRGQAHRDVMHALRDVQLQMAEDAGDVLALELMRLDDLFAAWWPLATATAGLLAAGKTAVTGAADAGGREEEGGDGRIDLLRQVKEQILASMETAGVNEMAAAVRMVVQELRREAELAEVVPDKDAARIVLDVMARRSNLLGLDKVPAVLLQTAPAAPANPYADMSDEELAHVIANFQAASG